MSARLVIETNQNSTYMNRERRVAPFFKIVRFG